MKRKYFRTRYRGKVEEPQGAEWLSIAEVRLWLPKAVREKLDPSSLPAEMHIHTDDADWALARSALRLILRCTCGEKLKFEIGWVDKIVRGLSKQTFRADVTFFEEGAERKDVFAISQLNYRAHEEAGGRMIREQFMLDAIQNRKASFSTPKPIGMIWSDGTLLSIATFEYGSPLEMKAESSFVKHPWEVIGKVAAEIHRFPTQCLPPSLEQHATRREHALSELERFREMNLPEVKEAVQWIIENLPPETESVLVHSDLLGQNILVTFDMEITVIDWEYAFVGDPAFDLAIVTRGSRHPFQVSDGLDLLLEAYHSSGGKEVTRKEVQVYELLMHLGWYEHSLERSRGDHPPEQHLASLRSLLKRVES